MIQVLALGQYFIFDISYALTILLLTVSYENLARAARASVPQLAGLTRVKRGLEMSSPANVVPPAQKAEAGTNLTHKQDPPSRGWDRAASVATVMSIIAQTFGLSMRAIGIVFLVSLVAYLVVS